ncbi:MAG: GNAT family N-acetyltransferase [Betaproteobacteria bacterium]
MLHFIDQIALDDWTFTVLEHDAGGVSLMPLYSEPGARFRRSALANYYASLYSPIISSAQNRRGAIAELVRELGSVRPRCAAVNLAPLDREAADTAMLADAFSTQGWLVKKYFCFGNWYLPCAGLSFADYMDGRPSRLRNTWQRKSRRFLEGHGARLEIVCDPAAVETAMDAFDRVYAKSWKQPEPYPRFVRRWAEICARKGWLRLGVAWIDDVPIAAQIWFTLNRRANIFKLAYDEAYSSLSAGTVLTAHMIRESLERDGVTEIDYLTGDDDYKRSWMTHRRERIGLLASNMRTPRGLAMGLVEWAGDVRRRLIQRRRNGVTVNG